GPTLSPAEKRAGAKPCSRQAALLERTIRARCSAGGRKPRRGFLPAEFAALSDIGSLDGLLRVDVAALCGARRHDVRLRSLNSHRTMGSGARGNRVFSMRVSGNSLEP